MSEPVQPPVQQPAQQPAASIRLKICGLRLPEQAAAVAALGVDAIGVIGVAASPRWLAPQQRPELFAALAAVSPSCQGVLVVADPSDRELAELDPERGHRIVQLHGQETPQRCRQLRAQLGCPIWKALRLRRSADLAQVQAYADSVDALLLDAWQPDQLGGTGQRIPLEWLADFAPPPASHQGSGVAAERVPARRLASRAGTRSAATPPASHQGSGGAKSA
ncbi:MAG: phosphoribosylanthranilate isomerase, partial [Prochlorococcaceae cyanobacterium]